MKHPLIITVQPDRPVTEIEFCAWVAQALPGDRLQYHRGFLVLDTFALFSRLGDTERDELRKLAGRAFWAAEQGVVHLPGAGLLRLYRRRPSQIQIRVNLAVRPSARRGGRLMPAFQSLFLPMMETLSCPFPKMPPALMI